MPKNEISEDKINIYEVVKKLTGSIEPVGETHTDNKRYENLLKSISLADSLINDIEEVAIDNEDRQAFSMKKAGEKARIFLNDINERTNDA